MKAIDKIEFYLEYVKLESYDKMVQKYKMTLDEVVKIVDVGRKKFYKLRIFK